MEGRALIEWTAWLMARPWFSLAPAGDGHPVLVLPGLIAGDGSTWPLRRFLETLGYAAYPWEQGINRGPRDGLLPRLVNRIESLESRHGSPVSLIGWSLGGAMARSLAFRMPERVRSVITLGSPLGGDHNGTNAARVFEWASGMKPSDPRLQRMLGGHPDVPMTSILSKSDGVVDWRMSLTPETARAESIEVSASHLGMGANPVVLWAIADRLAQRPETWQPFERSRWRQLLYRDPRRAPLEDLFGG
jgi:pimeloyl-ACP methyl ester carboxylesterase